MSSNSHEKTRFFIISDTHGEDPSPVHLPQEPVDVAIHCGDLTEESKLDELKASVRLLKSINARLKLVFAGNHEFTLDTPMFKKKLGEVQPSIELSLVKAYYGEFGEARELFEKAKTDGIFFLDEGNHRFALANGTRVNVFASPYTPSTNDWGFQYHP